MQEINGAIFEGQPSRTTGGNSIGDHFGGLTLGNINTVFGGGCRAYWNSYPVVCTDKAAKAIEILKALQSDKTVDIKSVPRFIELVEQISKIL